MNIHCCYHHFHGHCYIILYSGSPISIHLGVWLLFREGVLSLATKAHQGSHQGCSSGGPFWVQQPPLDPFFTTTTHHGVLGAVLQEERPCIILIPTSGNSFGGSLASSSKGDTTWGGAKPRELS